MYQVDQEKVHLEHCWNHKQPGCAGHCVFVYTSQPQPLPRYGRSKFRNNVPHPKGAGDYYNMMWDGRIFRGKPVKRPEKSFIECFNVRKSKTIVHQPRVIYERPPTPPPERRARYDGQTESNMEELDSSLIEDVNAVSDLTVTLDLPQCPSHIPNGIDVSTEILLGDIFDFDHQVIPITEALVGQIVECALHELLEEEELESLRIQQANFEALRLEEQLKLIELKEQHDCFQKEKLRVETDYTKEATVRIEAVAFSSLYLGSSLADIFDSLRYQNQDSQLQILISSFFNSWLNNLVQNEVKNQLICRDLLDDVILSTVQKRQADFFMGKWIAEQEELRQQRLALKMMKNVNLEYAGEDLYGME